MIIAKDSPSPGVESSILDIRDDSDLSTGTFTVLIRSTTMQEPRLLTTSCFNEPWFAIRVDLATEQGELLITLGQADGSHPQQAAFRLPRYLRDVQVHRFLITFDHWRILGVEMDEVPLKTADMPTELIAIHPDIETIVSACDLLRPRGSFPVKIEPNAGILFALQGPGFEFSLVIQGGNIILRRCGAEIGAPISSLRAMTIWIIWSPTQIQMISADSDQQENVSQRTSLVMPPTSLLRLAREKKLAPTSGFATMEMFRTAVHEALCGLQDDIGELGAYDGFWDQDYQGRRKGKPTPKRETDIHKQLLLPLFDWAKMRSVDVIPENHTAVGRLDICFIGNVDGQGPVPFCVEVKLAHANDLQHGLEVQLPEYMTTRRARYGAYVVLWFKGEWFARPSKSAIQQLRSSIIPGDYDPPNTELTELEFVLTSATAINPLLRNIRTFVLDVSKAPSASKKAATYS